MVSLNVFGISKNGSPNEDRGFGRCLDIYYDRVYFDPEPSQILADPYVIVGMQQWQARFPQTGVFIGNCIGAFIGNDTLCAVCESSVCTGSPVWD